MTPAARTLFVVTLCLALSGCFATFHGNQSTAGGTTTTVTSGQVSGSARFAGGRASFSSGQAVPANASGGTVKLSGNAAAVLVVGLVIADLVNYLRGQPQAKPLPPGTAISHTCSCYKQDSDEIKVTR
jgi:hypothetical protein